jgi:hypothetical protein
MGEKLKDLDGGFRPPGEWRIFDALDVASCATASGGAFSGLRFGLRCTYSSRQATANQRDDISAATALAGYSQISPVSCLWL